MRGWRSASGLTDTWERQHPGLPARCERVHGRRLARQRLTHHPLHLHGHPLRAHRGVRYKETMVSHAAGDRVWFAARAYRRVRRSLGHFFCRHHHVTTARLRPPPTPHNHASPPVPQRGKTSSTEDHVACVLVRVRPTRVTCRTRWLVHATRRFAPLRVSSRPSS